MFMLEYMKTGFDEVITSLTDEGDFDPHKYRKVPKPTTYSETMQHMLKGCLGAGMLAMPNAVRRMGILCGTLGILFIGIFATFCIQLLVLAQYELCKKMRRGYMSYTKSIRVAVEMGPKCMQGTANLFANAVDFFLLFWQIGICAIYYVFVAENLKQLILVYNGQHYSIRFIICCLYPVAVAMSMIKDLKLLTPFSTISNGLIVIGLIFTLFYLIEDDPIIDKEKFMVKGIAEIPVFIGITLFALEAVGVILALEYNLENPKEFTGWFGLFSVGMAIILTIFAVLGIAGYLKYGDECKGSITLNLPQNEKRAQTVKLSLALALLLSYPLQNFVAWQIAWRLTKKRFNNSTIADYTLRFFVGTLPFFMAVGAPNLDAFMGLLGALCLTMVAILFPAVMDICVYYPDRYGKFQYKLLLDIFIILFGMVCCASGVYTSLLEMFGEH